eukprot:scaffold44411_cov71-Phaeocystis_antarctica.AAC.2
MVAFWPTIRERTDPDPVAARPFPYATAQPSPHGWPAVFDWPEACDGKADADALALPAARTARDGRADAAPRVWCVDPVWQPLGEVTSKSGAGMPSYDALFARLSSAWESKGLCVGALAHDRASHVREVIGRSGRRPDEQRLVVRSALHRLVPRRPAVTAVDMVTDARPTTAGVSAATSAATSAEEDAWFTASGSRVAALLLFFVLSETAGTLRSGARTYFYRTGAVCDCPQLLAPGADGWSGSSYCGDNDAVIGFATRLSANLLFLQVGVDFLFTSVFAALADKWSCVGVIAIHIGVSCLALAGYSATAKQLPAAASAWHTEHHGMWDDGAGWDLEHPLAVNGTNCTADDVQNVLPLTLLIPSTVLTSMLHVH